MGIKGSYRSQFQEIDESGYIEASVDETGAMVVSASKGWSKPKKCTNQDQVIKRFGYPSATYPEIFEALAFVQEAPLWMASAVHENARWGGAYVTQTSVVGFTGGQVEPDDVLFNAIATYKTETVGTGTGTNKAWSTTLASLPLEHSLRIKRGSLQLDAEDDGGSVTGADIDGTGTIVYATGALNFDTKIAITSGELVTAEYDYSVDMSSGISHAFFAASPYVDDLAINIISQGGYKFKATLYTKITNAYITEYNYSLIKEKDGFGANLYILDVFDENDYVIVKVNSSYSGTTPSLSASTIVSFAGGRRGSTPTISDRTTAWDYYKKPNKYPTKIFMDTTGEVPDVLKGIIETYQYYAFGITCTPMGNTVAQNITYRNNLSIDFDGLALYTNRRKIYDSYNDSFAWISDVGAVGRKMSQMAEVFDGESPAGIDENGRGGQIEDWRTIEMEADFDDTDLKDLDEAQINPIVFDQGGYGVYIAGDRTLQVDSSDTSFIHTRRIDNYILEKVIKNVMRLREFRNNTSQSQLMAKAMVDEFLAPMVAKELITEVEVICDSRNNTAAVKTQRKFILDIIKKSTVNNQKTLLRLTRVGQGAVISEIIPV